MINKYTIGLDFGSDSVRALLVNCSSGQEIDTQVEYYPRWQQGKYSDANQQQFRHHPLDYIESMTKAIKAITDRIDTDIRNNIVGIGVDTTGSTPAPIDEHGNVLALLDGFQENPNAMFILWKDHTSTLEAQKITELCHSGKYTDYSKYIGGIYSSEWFWAKIAHIHSTDEQVKNTAKNWIELCDWIPALLTDTVHPKHIKRSVCAAGHKVLWNDEWHGLPDQEFLRAIHPSIVENLDTPLFDKVYTADQAVGVISKEWADKLNLPTNVVLAGGAFDCHMGAVGAGAEPNDLIKVIGTSTCDVMTSSYQSIGDKTIKGICGQVDGSILPGLIGLEAGQSAFGDIYAWFFRILNWPLELLKQENASLHAEVAQVQDKLLSKLTEEWDKNKNLDTLPIVLDWFNGRRTPNANQKLRGLIADLTLGTNAVDLFGSLIVATAFGSQQINECFTSQGVTIKRIIALGGISKKSPIIMQVCADVMNKPIYVLQSEQCCALGAAVFAAVAAGVYADTAQAQVTMASKVENIYQPNPTLVPKYNELYQEYKEWALVAEPINNKFFKLRTK